MSHWASARSRTQGATGAAARPEGGADQNLKLFQGALEVSNWTQSGPRARQRIAMQQCDAMRAESWYPDGRGHLHRRQSRAACRWAAALHRYRLPLIMLVGIPT